MAGRGGDQRTSTCNSCGGPAAPGEYLCRDCSQSAPRETPPLATSAPEFEAPKPGNCDRCPMAFECAERLIASETAWVMCEIPDEMDLWAASAELVKIAESSDDGWRSGSVRSAFSQSVR